MNAIIVLGLLFSIFGAAWPIDINIGVNVKRNVRKAKPDDQDLECN